MPSSATRPTSESRLCKSGRRGSRTLQAPLPVGREGELRHLRRVVERGLQLLIVEDNWLHSAAQVFNASMLGSA